MRRSVSWLGTLFLILLMLSCLGLSLWPIELLIYLAVGWLLFIGRVGPQITASLSGIATGIVALALFAVGSHWMFKWFYAARHSASETKPLRVWSARWTAVIVCAVVLIFVAGTAMVGIAHQVVWLATSDAPFLEGGIGERPRRSMSSTNLKQLVLALISYSGRHGSLPAGGTFDQRGRALHSWQTALLPYIEQGDLYERINFDVPWDNPENATVFSTVVPAFLNPGADPSEEDGFGLSHYAANPLVLGASPTKLADIQDGAGQTILAGEVSENFRPWGYPANWRDPRLGINRSPHGFGGPWRKVSGANFVFADGSVQFLSAETDPEVLQALFTPAGGEQIPSF
ncbi:MAG: DUF1559 domain-containing protein [Planctomycetota bacterium]|nr:DUF1559 domain-containing protein [Planctomycetota bacterium]